MANERDMTAPVTRGELHETIDRLLGALLARMNERFDALDARIDEVRVLVSVTRQQILDEVRAMFDPHRSVPERVTTLEQAALPERVSKLEAKVFAPKRRTTRRRS